MITIQQLIALLPILILGFTVVVVMLSIAWRRNNTRSAILAAVGMLAALASCFFITDKIPLAVTEMLRVDYFSLFYTGLVIIASVATVIFTHKWLTTFPDNKDEFYLLLLIATLGGVVLTSADHLVSLFVGIELLSLPLFGLIGYAYRQTFSIEAALKYMLLSSAASAFLLMGIAFLYAAVGELNFHSLGDKLSVIAIPPALITIGIGMIVIGIGFKLSVFPFQLWTPDVYQGAPSMVSLLLATTGKIAVFCVAVRLIINLPNVEGTSLYSLLILLSLCSILFGNLLAILQKDIKRMLAYSSVAHLGYLLIILITLNDQELATEASNVYFAGYLLSNIAAFGGLCVVTGAYAGHDVETGNELKGLYWRKPMLTLAMCAAFISLAGIPLTFGFIGKFYLLALGVYGQIWWIVGAIIVGSGLGLYYYLRVAVNLFLPIDRTDKFVTMQTSRRIGLNELVVLVAGFLIVFLGIYPRWIIDLAVWAQLT